MNGSSGESRAVWITSRRTSSERHRSRASPATAPPKVRWKSSAAPGQIVSEEIAGAFFCRMSTSSSSSMSARSRQPNPTTEFMSGLGQVRPNVMGRKLVRF